MQDCRHRYLVIDDDPGDIEILRRHLEQISAGTAEVLEFREPESALAELQSRDVDLIFIDYVLGEQTGLEVFQAIRDLGCSQPVVILTGQGSESIAVEAMKAGVADYIVKENLTADSVQRVVIHALAKSKLEQQLREQQRRLEELSHTDDLTGLANRRHFGESLTHHVLLASRHDLPLSLLMIDLDHFKHVNDTYGHLTGDHVLARTAEIIRGGLRATDIVGRYGGEEFCVLLPNTMISGAEEVAGKIRKTVAEEEFKTVAGEGLRVTCSVGVAQLPRGGGDPEALLNHADKALYAAKDAGRNIVVIAPAVGDPIIVMSSPARAEWSKLIRPTW